MPLEEATYYCTQADAELILSAHGVKLRLDDDQDDEVSSTEQEAMDFALGDAAVTIDSYLGYFHTPAILATSRWVNNRAAWITVGALCGRRGNPEPESLTERVDRILEELEYHRKHSRPLPGVPVRTALMPGWSNMTIDLRYNWKVLRVNRHTSSRNRSQLQTFRDWRSAFSWEY